MTGIELTSLIDMLAAANELVEENREQYQELLKGSKNIHSKQVLAVLHLMVKKGLSDTQ